MPLQARNHKFRIVKTLSKHLIREVTLFLLSNSPMFVTWKTKKDHQLRGCIGTTSPINLIEGLRKYSIVSALHDGRFEPIKANELESLCCSISLLTDFERCKSYSDWIIGVHGVSIKFEVDGRLFNAIFLPEVMIEHSNKQK